MCAARQAPIYTVTVVNVQTFVLFPAFVDLQHFAIIGHPATSILKQWFRSLFLFHSVPIFTTISTYPKKISPFHHHVTWAILP
jgi:hypothetical protein